MEQRKSRCTHNVDLGEKNVGSGKKRGVRTGDKPNQRLRPIRCRHVDGEFLREPGGVETTAERERRRQQQRKPGGGGRCTWEVDLEAMDVSMR